MKYQKELLVSLLAIVVFAGFYAFETAQTNAKLEDFSIQAGTKLTELIDAIDAKFDSIDDRLDALEGKKTSAPQPTP